MSKVEMISMCDASQILDSVSPKGSGILRRGRIVPSDAVSRAIEAISTNLFDGVMVVLDPKAHTITQINDPYCVLSGGYGDSVVNQDFAEMIPTTKRHAIKKLFNKLFASRVRRPVVEITIPLGLDENTAESIRARVYCNEGGICLLVDKTELSKMQEIEVIRLKALVSGSSDSGFWVTDTNGIIKDVVGQNCSLNLGYDEKELLGMNIASFIKGGMTTNWRSEGNRTMEIYRCCKDGEYLRTEVVQKKIVMNNGEEYILHLDDYSHVGAIR